MTNTNPCIETVTTKKVVEGRIKAPAWFSICQVLPSDGGVVLHIDDQIYTKSDLKYLINRLSEIHEVL